MDNEQEASTENPSLRSITIIFIMNIESLAETFPITTSVTRDAIEKGRKNLEPIINNLQKIVDEAQSDDNKRPLKERLPTLLNAFDTLKRIHKANLAKTLIQRSFIISLISLYDEFLSSLIQLLFQIHPESLNVSEKNITLSQLQEFESIEAAKEYFIEKEVEAVLYKSHAEQIDWLENKFGIKIREGLSIWPTFIEITERRNLFVHNSGIVNSQYLGICKKHKVNLPEGTHIGSQLGAAEDYFEIAYQCIFEVGVRLAHVLWRKVQPEEREAADSTLNSICYDLLSKEQFKLACRILDFATTELKKYSNERNKCTFIVNRAQAYKWAGENETARKFITVEDWTATDDMFRLAEAVLLDEFDRANSIVKKIGDNGKVTKMAYREWPLFKEYRESESFLKTFEQVFGEPLQPVDTQLESQFNNLLHLSAELSNQPPEAIDPDSTETLDQENLADK